MYLALLNQCGDVGGDRGGRRHQVELRVSLNVERAGDDPQRPREQRLRLDLARCLRPNFQVRDS